MQQAENLSFPTCCFFGQHTAAHHGGGAEAAAYVVESGVQLPLLFIGRLRFCQIEKGELHRGILRNQL